MPILNQVPIPLQDRIAKPHRPEYGKRPDPQEGLLGESWIPFFTQQGQLIQSSASRVGGSGFLTQQGTSIAATDMSGGTTTAGLYRVTYYARIQVPAGTNSSLTVTIDWTDGGVSPSFSGAALVGNTTTTVGTDTFMFRADNLSPIRFSTAYVSVGVPDMKYVLEVVLEVMPG